VNASSTQRPVRHRVGELSFVLEDVAADGRVVRQLHLVDRHAVGIEIERPLDADAPVLVRLPEHARDQIDVDLREAERTRKGVCPADFGRSVRASVQFEDAIVEVLDAKTEACDAHPADGLQLRFRECAGLALERNFGCVRP
jgi:hypothetical protein